MPTKTFRPTRPTLERKLATIASSALTLPLAAALIFGASVPVAAQDYTQPQAAPIQRAAPAPTYSQPARPMRPAIKSSQPAPGVWLHVSPQGSVTTLAATADRTELRVDSGVANITVHHPANDALILVDIGGGQVDLIKDGLYTFNADTKTMRVLVGEADAFTSMDANSNAKPVKVKGDHAITFGAASLRTVEFAPFQTGPDLLPSDSARAHGDGPAYVAPYGYGFYGYPYAAYGWGEPFGWGYPYGVGFGFGYYGGFGYGGGFYGGGFRGRR